MKHINMDRKKIQAYSYVLATIIGIILSLYLLINVEFINGFKFSNIDKMLLRDGLINSLICGVLGLILSVIVFTAEYCYTNKRDVKNFDNSILTQFSLIIFLISVLLIIVPFIAFGIQVFIVVIMTFFILLNISDLILRVPIYIFYVVLDSILSKTGIKVEYVAFIGQDKFSLFLQIIMWCGIAPYVLIFLLKGIKNLLEKYFGINHIFATSFKNILIIVTINTIRYPTYFILFFISIIVYIYKIDSQSILGVIKESLVTFVLLDTVAYSLYCNAKEKKRVKDKILFHKVFIPIKKDLEGAKNEIINNNLVKFNDTNISMNFTCKNILEKYDFQDKNKEWADIFHKVKELTECKFTYGNILLEIDMLIDKINLLEAFL